MRLNRILIAFSALLALILDELWRMGRMRDWTWEWVILIGAIAVILTDIGRARDKI